MKTIQFTGTENQLLNLKNTIEFTDNTKQTCEIVCYFKYNLLILHHETIFTKIKQLHSQVV